MNMQEKTELYSQWAAKQKTDYAEIALVDSIAYSHRYMLTGTMGSVLLGMNRYRTAAELYDEFYASAEGYKPKDTFAIRFGRQFEEFALEQYERERAPLMRNENGRIITRVYHRDDEPWTSVQVDGIEKQSGYGVEIKTAGANFPDAEGHRPWGTGDEIVKGVIAAEDDQIPDEYLCQVTEQMRVMGTDRARVAVLFRSSGEMRYYTVRYNRDLGEAIREAKERFLFENLIPHVRPEADDISLPVAEGSENAVLAAEDTEELLLRLAAAKLRANEAEKERKELDAQVRALFGNARHIVDASGKVLAMLTPMSRRSLNQTKLKEEMPEVYAQYYQSVAIAPRLTIKIKEAE